MQRPPTEAASVVIDGLTGFVRQLELDPPPCLPLPDCCAVDCVAIGCNVIDLAGYDIAATKLCQRAWRLGNTFKKNGHCNGTKRS
jgi:hypothetical protein